MGLHVGIEIQGRGPDPLRTGSEWRAWIQRPCTELRGYFTCTELDLSWLCPELTGILSLSTVQTCCCLIFTSQVYVAPTREGHTLSSNLVHLVGESYLFLDLENLSCIYS